jgi:alpha-beta hydrolase superfamily lysophospholipase
MRRFFSITAILALFLCIFPYTLFGETYAIYHDGNFVGYEEITIVKKRAEDAISFTTSLPYAIDPKRTGGEIATGRRGLTSYHSLTESAVMTGKDEYDVLLTVEDFIPCQKWKYHLTYDSAVGFKSVTTLLDKIEFVLSSDTISGLVEMFQQFKNVKRATASCLVTTLSPYFFVDEVPITSHEARDNVTIEVDAPLGLRAVVYGNDKDEFPDKIWLPDTKTLYLLTDDVPIDAHTPDLAPSDIIPEAREVSFPSADGTMLSGVITLPEKNGDEPAPLVVMVPGIGPHRWYYMGIYADLAEEFLEHGIASFMWDKRGCGESRGSYYRRTPELLLSDVRAAIDEALKVTGADPDHLILLGHSEGGFLSLLTTANDGRIAGLVVLSAPAMPLPRVFTRDAAMGARRLPLSRAERREYRKTYEEMFRWITESPVDSYVSPGCRFPDRTLFLGHFRGHNEIAPHEYIEAIDVPVLILHGEGDFVVRVENAYLTRDILAEAGNHRIRLITYEDLDHNMGAATPAGGDGKKSEIILDPAVRDDIVTWLSESFGF